MPLPSIEQRLAIEIAARPAQISAAVALLDEGATVPFIARYRKEVTGGLDDTQLRNLAERLVYLREFEARRAAIVGSITDQGKMTDALAQGLAKATIVGHSMGGKTAMLLACRHPARVERLVIVDIAPKDYNWAAHRAEFLAMAELDLGSLQSRAEAEMRFEARVPHLGTRKFLATNLARHEHGPWHWAINLPVLTESLRVMEKSSLPPDDRFTGPTLFVLGGRSHYAEDSDHELIRKHFPAARIEVIADSGHNPHMDHREEFVRLVVGG